MEHPTTNSQRLREVVATRSDERALDSKLVVSICMGRHAASLRRSHGPVRSHRIPDSQRERCEREAGISGTAGVCELSEGTNLVYIIELLTQADAASFYSKLFTRSRRLLTEEAQFSHADGDCNGGRRYCCTALGRCTML